MPSAVLHPIEKIARCTVAVTVHPGASAAEQRRARLLAAELDLPTTEASTSPPLTLEYGRDGLALCDHRARRRPLTVDFSPLAQPRAGARLTRCDPLARAVGRTVRTLVDATAGFGWDAMRLACLGLEVRAIERAPVCYALLRDGLARARDMPALASCAARLHLQAGEAAAILPTLSPPPDAIYLDPMYPPKRRRSAATRKELALLRELVGTDLDAAALLALSLRVARERVIVKRPDGATPLVASPTVSYGGKLVRYDVYRTDTR